MFGSGAKIARSRPRLELGPYYEVIRTRGGDVGVIYDHADPFVPRDAILHAIHHDIGSPTDTALSILAHHFRIKPHRAMACTFGTPQTSAEELLAKFFSHFLGEFIKHPQESLAPDSSFTIHSELIREWANLKLKSGAIRW